MKEETGTVFDIEEFAVFDGPGIRTAVFLKGCPLRCNWCHNPEGLSPSPQRVVSGLCVHCGLCERACPTPGRCTGCGACVSACPRGCIRIAGQQMTASQLAAAIRRNEALLEMNGGGVTFSGGECTMQAEFTLAVCRLLPGIHKAMETCGHVNSHRFRLLLVQMDLVFFDIKHTDPALHLRHTGVTNTLIRQNLEILKASGVPFRVRVPLIPGVNDTPENLEATAQWVQDCPTLEGVELLPYHKAAGAKYKSVGLDYRPEFDTDTPPRLITKPFEQRAIRATII